MRARAARSLLAIAALYLLLRQLLAGGLAAAFPLAEAGAGYAALFIIGLITSVHCVAMCGGINLSQTLAPASPATPVRLVPSVLYNAGRVASYTLVGAIVGAAGSAITVSGRFQGAVQLAAGLCMAVMGGNMLGLFPALPRLAAALRAKIRLPQALSRSTSQRRKTTRRPLIVGLLNGLMPCGPLQAMQLFALSTGSALGGAAAMFIFSAGTVPLMFGFGALGSVLSGSSRGRGFAQAAARAGAVLVTVLGLSMCANGWSLGGLPSVAGLIGAVGFPSASPAAREARGGQSSSAAASGNPASGPALPPIENGVQVVRSTLRSGRYPAITVRAGTPVRWMIDAPAGSVNGCNNRMIIREYGLEHRFTVGSNTIEFTPVRPGRVPFSCWMGMVRSAITVVPEDTDESALTAEAARQSALSLAPVPAGVAIDASSIALAALNKEEKYQEAETLITDEGLTPSVLVVERGVPVKWTIINSSADAGSSPLLVPFYRTRLGLERGANEAMFVPAQDFEFSTADNALYGYIKVVDALEAADIDAIKREASDFETLIYPDSRFDDEG
jgi:sulfite exporter TauE/SafE